MKSFFLILLAICNLCAYATPEDVMKFNNCFMMTEVAEENMFSHNFIRANLHFLSAKDMYIKANYPDKNLYFRIELGLLLTEMLTGSMWIHNPKYIWTISIDKILEETSKIKNVHDYSEN